MRTNDYRKACYIVGVAYDNLLWDEDQNNGGFLSDAIYEAWPKHDQSTMVACSVSSTQEELYSDPAVRLTLSDVRKMPIQGAPITDEHTGKRVGIVTNKWIDDGGRLMVEAHVQDLDTAEKARRGKYTGLSVGYVFDTVGKKVTKKTFNHLAVCEDPVFDKCRFVVTASKTGETSQRSVGDAEFATPTLIKSASSGIRIEAINDEPLKKQINNSNGDKYGRSCPITPLRPFKSIRMENQGQGAPSNVGFEQQAQQPPQQQQSSIPSFHAQSQQQHQQQQQPPPPQQSNQFNDNANATEEKDEKEKQSSLITDEEIRRLWLKKDKMREMKAKLQQYEQEKQQQTQAYLKGQEPKKKAFVEFAKRFNDGELPEDVEGVIEGSFTTPGYEGWTTLLERMSSEHARLSETLEREQKELESMRGSYNDLKRKNEKDRNMFKYMKTGDGDRKKVSFQEGTKASEGGKPPSLFKVSSSSGFSSAPHVNAKTPRVESLFNKKAATATSTAPATTGMATGGNKSGGFLEESRRMSVTASRGGANVEREMVGEFEVRQETGILNQLDPSLWDSFNRQSGVDPRADAYQYLAKSQSTDGIAVVRYQPSQRY